MKKISLFSTILIFLFNIQFSNAQDANTAEEFSSFDQVTEASKKQGKPVLLVIRSNDCSSCRIFANKVLADTGIQSLYQKNFIYYLVISDSKEGRKLSYKYNVMSYPAVIYFNPDQEIIHTSNGSDKVFIATDEANRVLNVHKTMLDLKQQAMLMNTKNYLGKKVQKKVAANYARRDAEDGKTEAEKQAFDYTLNGEDLIHFKKHYVKTLNNFN